jgi:hypothetical protein
MIFEVETVLDPFLIHPPHLQKFQLGMLVAQGKEYGIVTQIDESDRPITIAWDCSTEEPFAYTLDEINVLKVAIVPLYHPKQTLVELPAGTTIKLTDGEVIRFDRSTIWLVESVARQQISISQAEKIYQFAIEFFPGKPFANLIELPKLTGEQPELSLIDLKIKAEIWLSLYAPSQFLEIITSAWQQQLKQQFSSQLEQRYCQEDLDIAWELSWSSFLDRRVMEEGLYGLKKGSRVLRKIEPNIELFGIVRSIQIDSLRPFQIAWENGTSFNYNFLELQSLKITRLCPLTQLSPNVTYQINDDGSYFKAYIAFRSKALANAWLKPIKAIVGRLGHLHKYELEQLRHIPDRPWEYEVEKPKYKTLAKNLEAIQKVAQLDLDSMPRARKS